MKDWDNELVAASDNKDLAKVKEALNHGANIHYGYDVPLWCAIWHHNEAMVKYLLDHGASIRNCICEDENDILNDKSFKILQEMFPDDIQIQNECLRIKLECA